MAEATHYEVLGVAADATDKEIKKAYRKLVIAHHPDKDRSEGAAERFQRIQQAYDVLSDPLQRRRYDDALESGASGEAEEANPEHATLLMFAVEKGDMKEAADLLSQGARVDEMDAFDRTALMYAAAAGQGEAVELLVNARASLEHRDSEGMTPLIYAAGGKRRLLEMSAGTMHSIRFLLAADADVNAASLKGLTPLSLACRSGSQSVAFMLLGRKAAPNQVVGDTLSPLAVAAQQGHVKIIDMLLGGTANPNMADADGETALMVASAAGHEAVIEKLIGGGADATACMQDGGAALLFVVEEYADRRLSKDVTLAVVKRLVDMQADPIAATLDGRTPLKTAARAPASAWLEDMLYTAAAANKTKNTSCMDCLAGFKIMFGVQ